MAVLSVHVISGLTEVRLSDTGKTPLTVLGSMLLRAIETAECYFRVIELVQGEASFSGSTKSAFEHANKIG